MKKSVEKSQEQAEIIKMICLQASMLDLEYCREAGSDMCNQANRQEAMAVLNPHHPQEKNDILRAQGKALLLLCEYIQTLKDVDSLKEKLKKRQVELDKTNSLFI